MQTINYQKLDRELKKGSAELLILSLLEARSRHGYEVRKLIEKRSDGVLKFNARLALRTALPAGESRLDRRPLGGKAGQRRRRYYKLTREGKQVLAAQRSIWESFVAAINHVTRPENV
jgi:PadR family transcriptional regulator, regulatory protein PadR